MVYSLGTRPLKERPGAATSLRVSLVGFLITSLYLRGLSLTPQFYKNGVKNGSYTDSLRFRNPCGFALKV
jgi:hypothetical protein